MFCFHGFWFVVRCGVVMADGLRPKAQKVFKEMYIELTSRCTVQANIVKLGVRGGIGSGTKP